jgi:hypothetical protein
MPKKTRNTRKMLRKSKQRKTRKARQGYFPTGSIVSYQQEPYSATILRSIENAVENSKNVEPKFNF